MTTPRYHVPERPYGPIDALNRRAAALGSPGYAMAASGANYNGHRISVSYNDYRGYYIAQYYWGERVVLARGSFEHCLRAALDYYERGALGASVSVCPREDDAEANALCEAEPLLKPGALSEDPREWYTWRHQCAAASARDSANPRMLVMRFDWDLMQASASEEDYCAALRAKYGREYC